MVNLTGTKYGDETAASSNPDSVLYIKGDEETDGSIRLIPDVTFGTQAEFQIRENGVWNDTGIQIAGATVYLGHELRLSAGGEYLLTRDVSVQIKALSPHIEYTDASGSSDFTVTPRLGALVEDQVVEADESGEFVGTSYNYSNTLTTNFMFVDLTFKTGSVAATEPVTVTFRRTDPSTGTVFFRTTIPASTLTANTSFTVTIDGLVQFKPGDVAYVIFESDANFSLKTNAAGDFPTRNASFHTLTEDPMPSLGVMNERLLINATANTLFNANGEILYGGAAA